MASMTAEPMLEARGIGKSFGALKVLHDVDLRVMPGEALGVVGPNGAGKTTLFGAMAGAFPISSGTIRLAGQNLSGSNAAERCRMGLARTHQVPRPFTGLTVFENIHVAAVAGAGLSITEATTRATGILERTGLTAYANRPAGALGLLDRKRLEVARALATGPRVVLLDEIGGGLTEAELDELIALIQGLQAEGLTIIWIEHILHALLRVVTRLACMAEGRILAEGDPRDVIAHADVQRAYLGSSPE
ncbi:ABC transporter ATP-binding protein [Roseinatronobacter alkalisoli]|uniref:ABC transporter ATP-binding protein n=1 Tax=Roseinatronobacter alkalisoli TaxID=3028235 RepID=A0ABT5T769_9RHOB|nr:ABC transporter ATP-binding protein [Roseinatronobacter sp. HJB301]MDD7970957.1 ABC transporter ATP-binding protein [Roseinatronobacter sp. HJB301]